MAVVRPVHLRGLSRVASVKVCPYCSNGLPICTDHMQNGQYYLHRDTCETYDWDTDVCAQCSQKLGFT